MAKINHITIKDVTRYLETIAYLSELPTATEDSADLVSVNNTLYVKQVTDGVYSYGTIQAGGGNVPSGDGITIVEKTLMIDDYTIESGLKGGTLNLTEEEKTLLNNHAYLKINWLDVAEQPAEGVLGLYPSNSVVLFGTLLYSIGFSILGYYEYYVIVDSDMLVAMTPSQKTLLTTPLRPTSNDNTWSFTEEEYSILLANNIIQLNDEYGYKTHISNDGTFGLSTYNTTEQRWYHAKPNAELTTTEVMAFTLDEEDMSNPYCDGGTDGSAVVVNSSDEATGTLTKLTVDGVTYGVPVVEIEDLTSL